ncbi:MAG: sodium:alanine symporter family protein, partial [Rhodocyclaceae bacterium]|nr:sodium:alanine symporter family protein [Rhodocyclaceae bacterium]
MEQFANLVSMLNGIVWGPYMLALLVGTGVWLTIRLAGLQFHMLAFALKQAFTPHPKKEDGTDHEGDVSHFGSLMTALSATIGTGNIAGVATAVVTGGPGAVFWMWITAIFGMATKYAEGLLAVKYRVVNERGEMNGGPMYYIERGLNMKWLAVAFALFGALASFGIGSSVQANSVADAVWANFEIDKLYTGIVLMVLTGIVVLGGIRSIAAAASAIVPLMAVVYVLGGLVVLFLHFDMILPALSLIVHDAFTGQAVAGGAMGLAVRYGVARGVFSNEAGMGSAPIAAAAARTDHPVRQALVSMTGTFL